MAVNKITSSGQNQTILGLDPGSRTTGYGLVAEHSGELYLIETGTIRPNPNQCLSDKLSFIYSKLSTIIERFHPQEAAVEDVFVANNSASALKLGQARGAVLVACANQDLPVFTYEPTLVKKTVVGVGRAKKEQVAFMVRQLLNVKDNWAQDCSDALAVAICHLNTCRQKMWI